MYLFICIFDEEYKVVIGYCVCLVFVIYIFNVFVINSLLVDGLRYCFICICVY